MFISKSTNTGLSGVLFISPVTDRPWPSGACSEPVLYSQQCCLYWLLPPSPLPTLRPSTWDVPEVSTIHTFLDAHIVPQARPRLGQWGLVSAPALASLCLAPLLAYPSLSLSARLHKDSSCRDKSWQKSAQVTAWGLTEPQQPVHMGPGVCLDLAFKALSSYHQKHHYMAGVRQALPLAHWSCGRMLCNLTSGLPPLPSRWKEGVISLYLTALFHDLF